MKKLTFLAIIIAGIFLTYCKIKTPDYVNSIPDEAFGVVSMHPMQIHEKGQINTLENLKKKIDDELLREIIDDPLKTGLMMDAYAYLFVSMKDDGPQIGAVAGMANTDKFETLLKSMDDMPDEFIEKDGFTMVVPDKEGAIGWNDEKMILLVEPDGGRVQEEWEIELETLFNLSKEESLTSMVDFKDFTWNMKDLNAWFSSDKLRDMLEHMDTDMNINLPFTLYNNYAHLYCEFANGEILINGETHFSEEVKKNVDEYLVMKDKLNSDMLELAPGGNLLMAVAASMDIEKFQKVMKEMAPPDADKIGKGIENAIGVSANELWQSFTGDFVLSVNAIDDAETMIPVELFIGLGIKDEALQDKLMGTVENMAPVEKEGDFFVINAQGIEVYSGIVNGIWVITNAAGYKNAVKGGGLKSPLPQTKFKDFTNESSGMYLNLDFEAYPDMITQQLAKTPERKEWLEYMTESFNYLGASSGNYNSHMIIETKKPNENSLYTFLKMTEMMD